MTRPELFRALAELAPGRLPFVASCSRSPNGDFAFMKGGEGIWFIPMDAEDTNPRAALFIILGLEWLKGVFDHLEVKDGMWRLIEGLLQRPWSYISLDAVLQALVTVLKAMKEQEG